MLHSWIIEELEKEEERRREGDRPIVEIPIMPPEGWRTPLHEDRTREEKSERGVAIIDLGFNSSDPPSDF